jgi:hypothetical protein
VNTGRLVPDGKANISAERSGLLERIGTTTEIWWARIEKLSKSRLPGRFFASPTDDGPLGVSDFGFEISSLVALPAS